MISRTHVPIAQVYLSNLERDLPNSRAQVYLSNKAGIEGTIHHASALGFIRISEITEHSGAETELADGDTCSAE